MTQACTPLSEKRLFLLDMDGTLYLGDRLFEATPAFLQCIRDKGGRYLFLTNNSSRGVDAYIEKMNCFGIKTEADDYLTSTDATIVYLKHHHAGQLIFAVGTASFCRQLIQAGIRLTDDIADNPDVLVLAYDTELTYRKLTDATRLLLRGIPYIATNPDLVCPTDFGSVDNTFVIDGQQQTVPNGVAHFLEHKLFEKADHDAFDLFGALGADANAYTDTSTNPNPVSYACPYTNASSYANPGTDAGDHPRTLS